MAFDDSLEIYISEEQTWKHIILRII
jgi:hypothetical protein